MTSGNNSTLRRLLAVLLLTTAGLLGTVTALSAAAREWDVQQLMQGMAEVKSAKSKFTERKYLSILSAPMEFSGTLVYAAPGRLEKNTLLPMAERLVLEQDRLTIESKAKNQRRTLSLQDYPAVWAFVEGIRSTLAGDLPTLNRFYRVNLEGSAEQWLLLLTPIEAEMKTMVREIRIGGSKNRIGSIEIIEAEGDRSVMTVLPDNDR